MIVPQDGNSSSITKVPATPGSPLQGPSFLFLPFSVAIVSSGEDDVVCISRPPDALAFLCPQTRLALLFPLLYTGEHLIAFPSLRTPCIHMASPSQKDTAFESICLHSPRAPRSWVSSWDDHFHSTPGWGFVAAAQCTNQCRAKNHVRAPGGLPEMRVLLLGLSLFFVCLLACFSYFTAFRPSFSPLFSSVILLLSSTWVGGENLTIVGVFPRSPCAESCLAFWRSRSPSNSCLHSANDVYKEWLDLCFFLPSQLSFRGTSKSMLSSRRCNCSDGELSLRSNIKQLLDTSLPRLVLIAITGGN